MAGPYPNHALYPRNQEIVERFREGVTMRELAAEHGISFQRIQQIIKREGVDGWAGHRLRATRRWLDKLDPAMKAIVAAASQAGGDVEVDRGHKYAKRFAFLVNGESYCLHQSHRAKSTVPGYQPYWHFPNMEQCHADYAVLRCEDGVYYVIPRLVFLERPSIYFPKNHIGRYAWKKWATYRERWPWQYETRQMKEAEDAV